MNTATRKPFGERGDSCADFGHEHNRHHHHCYHCGRTTGEHHSWCPDGGTAPDDRMVGWWRYRITCQNEGLDVSWAIEGE